VQIYTGLVYEGPAMVREMVTGLADRLRAHGFTALAQAVGVDASPRSASL
jgi:dihydroorotate dehydrogenase